MSYFIGKLRTETAGTRRKDRLYLLLSPFGFASSLIGQVITVPAGFETDMASIPHLIQPFIQKDEGGILEAAVIHDYLYSKEGPKVTRKQADQVFLEAMTIGKVGPVKRGMAFNAVRWFGGRSWKKR